MARLVGDPLLVDVVVRPRLHAHHLALGGVDLDGRAAAVEHVDRVGRAVLPRARREGVGLGGERADGAEVDDVTRHLRVERRLHVRRNLHRVACEKGEEEGGGGGAERPAAGGTSGRRESGKGETGARGAATVSGGSTATKEGAGGGEGRGGGANAKRGNSPRRAGGGGLAAARARTTANGAKGVDACDLLGEADASGAVDAARHRGLDDRAEVLVLDRALHLRVARAVRPVGHRLVLQVALAALVADGAVERVVGEEELHDALARLLDHRGAGVDLHPRHRRHRARSHLHTGVHRGERGRRGETGGSAAGNVVSRRWGSLGVGARDARRRWEERIWRWRAPAATPRRCSPAHSRRCGIQQNGGCS